MTYTIAKMNFIDVSALDDAIESTNDNESFGNLALLKEQTESLDYGTLELNQFILDGSKSIMPEAPLDVPFWSDNKSNTDLCFTNNPTLKIDFTTEHTSAGITLYFNEIYPRELTITWNTLDGNKIISKTFNPDSLIYFCRQKCANYGQIVIEFTKTQLPTQYIKLQYVMYGQWLEWEKDTITEASLKEDMDVTSNTLSINTLDISILDTEDDFNIGIDNGNWENVQKTQEITVQEYVNEDIVECGTFYMDSWDFKDNVASFGLIDAIGYLDRYAFKEGQIYNGIKASVVIDSIMASAGFKKYSIHEEVKDILLYGYIKTCSCRDALQQVCFALGAVADCSRSDTIKIYKPDRYISHDVGPSRKFAGVTQISLDDYVSGVSIKYNTYTLDTDATDVYKDTELLAGDNELTFSTPIDPTTLTVSGGILKTARTNYCIITMEASGTVTISAKKYNSTENSCNINLQFIKSGESENIKEYSGLTLRPTSYADKAKELLDYYALQKNVDMEYLLEDESVGNWLSITDTSNVMSVTLLESQSIDLTSGFISSAKCRGYSKIVTDVSFMTEFYMGEWGLI